ncbi:helix-turn-helix transcriptional regulator [Streptomyces sp. NPDC018610]|uniref:helix-turn-helix transcriptional regulator n=1 Tax=Streptomyces sp. NPDC018610 TaxID=3365049 RepID=UPI003791136B
MKSDRLLSILLLLQTRGRVPARELAERLEVSVRTVYRDVEALSAAGVPVYAERGRHGGIELLAGFRTDVTGLTADESRALFVLAAEGAHAALGLDAALGSALRKVMAALPAPHRPAAEAAGRRILVDATRWKSAPHRPVDLAVLQDAVFADRRLRLRYRHSGDNESRTYTVDPYGLVAKAGVWYLVADRRGSPRLFRADRVRSARLLEDAVRRRPGVELADAWEVLRRRVEELPGGFDVTARVRRGRLDMFLRVHGPSMTAHPEDDGEGEWVTVRLSYGSPRAVRQLLGFSDQVEVVSPPEARAELRRAAASVARLYADGDGGAGADADEEGAGGTGEGGVGDGEARDGGSAAHP